MVFHQPKPNQQIDQAMAFLKKYACRLDGTAFRLDNVPVPPVPAFGRHTQNEMRLLPIYLPANSQQGEVERTFEAWWDFIQPQGWTKSRWENLLSDVGNLKLISEVEHEPGIRWGVLNPNAYADESARTCWRDSGVAPILASVEVLTAAATFDNWAPDCNISGYQFNSGNVWDMVPCLTTRDVPGKLRLCAYGANDPKKGRSNPTFELL